MCIAETIPRGGGRGVWEGLGMALNLLIANPLLFKQVLAFHNWFFWLPNSNLIIWILDTKNLIRIFCPELLCIVLYFIQLHCTVLHFPPPPLQCTVAVMYCIGRIVLYWLWGLTAPRRLGQTDLFRQPCVGQTHGHGIDLCTQLWYRPLVKTHCTDLWYIPMYRPMVQAHVHVHGLELTS